MLAARQRRGLAPPYPPRARVVLARARLDAVAGLAGTVGDELRADRRRPRIGVQLVGRARRPQPDGRAVVFLMPREPISRPVCCRCRASLIF